jgi:hypothetical protein
MNGKAGFASPGKNGTTHHKEMTMNAFNKEYFFILLPGDERIPSLTPDEDTVEKPYEWEVLPIGGKPLIFYNGAYDFQKGNRIIPLDPPPEILFDGNYPVVIDRIADKLRDLEIPNFALQPAIFIDHKNNWHENYWFLTFTAKFDCWDRNHSEYSPKPVDTDPIRYSLYTYSLNEELFQKTPLVERLLFQMGGTTDGFIVAHQSIVVFFRVDGVDIVPLTDYGVNYP